VLLGISTFRYALAFPQGKRLGLALAIIAIAMGGCQVARGFAFY
jgi:hypothetical protein